jgi:hypothetical protein
MAYTPLEFPMDSMDDLVAELVAFEQDIIDAASADELGLDLPLLHYTEGCWDDADEAY